MSEASRVAAETYALEQSATEKKPEYPTDQDIRTVAYLRYLDSGGQHGNDLHHWFEAESLLRSR